jgi:hypothetical protein
MDGWINFNGAIGLLSLGFETWDCPHSLSIEKSSLLRFRQCEELVKRMHNFREIKNTMQSKIMC